MSQKIALELEKERKKQEDAVFDGLRRLLNLAQREDTPEEKERKEMSRVIEEIRQKRAIMALVMYTSPSEEERMDLFEFLSKQHQRLSLFENDCSKYFCIDASLYSYPFSSNP